MAVQTKPLGRWPISLLFPILAPNNISPDHRWACNTMRPLCYLPHAAVSSFLSFRLLTLVGKMCKAKAVL